MIRSFPGNRSLRLTQGDITQVAVDAICNAANSQLVGGGGVDGAIHRAGGPAIMRELDQLRKLRGGCPTGSAVATGAGRLPAKWVFHAVGPVYRDGASGEPEALRSAYQTCLVLAEEKHVEQISFPSISTGVYGYPVQDAAVIALDRVAQHLKEEGHKLQHAVFVLFDDRTLAAYSNVLRSMPL